MSNERSATVRLAVVGSVNLDLVARVARLPRAGETVTNATLARCPGGKGANQALAACRLGANVTLLACVGRDPVAEEALALLREDGVDLSRLAIDDKLPTGMALISVDADSENQIVVAPGANRGLTPARLQLPPADALICQLEIPAATLEHAARGFRGFLCVNLAPIMDVPDALLERADLVVVNELEAAHYAARLAVLPGLVALTYGRRGAELRQAGEVIATAVPPAVASVDTTGAGDAFTAALTLALVEGQAPAAALQFATVAAAASTCGQGAQPPLPWRRDLAVALP